MVNSSTARKRKLISALLLVTLSVLTILAFSSTVKAQNDQLTIQLSPTSGPVGTPVSVYGLGFSGGTVTISFNSQQVGSAYPAMFGRISGVFQVPSVSQGDYTVTATASSGSSASATFTVTAKTSSPTSGTGTNTGTTPGTGSVTTPGTNTEAVVPAGVASITLSASSGNVGKPVTVKGAGFGAGTFVTINFASTYVAATTADNSGKITIGFTVPMESPGFYTVSATTSNGIFASQSFTVTSSVPGTGTNQNAGTGSGSFWTGLNTAAVGLVVAAVVIAPLTFVYMRRGRKEPLMEEQPVIQPQMSPYSRAPPPPSQSPYSKPAGIASRYDQFAGYGHQTSHGPQAPRTYSASRPSAGSSSYSAYSSQVTRRPATSTSYSQQARYSPQPANTVTCHNCRQSVRADYNICPYCRKKIR